MVNTAKLRGRIVEKGTTLEGVAKSIGMARSTLYRKMTNSNGDCFTVGQVKDIMRVLDLSNEEAILIFLSE